MRQHLAPMLQPAGSPGLLERGDQAGQGAVVDTPAALGSGDGEADVQMGFSDAPAGRERSRSLCAPGSRVRGGCRSALA